MKKILWMLATTSCLFAFPHTSVWSIDPYDAIPQALDQVESALNQGNHGAASAQLKAMQSEYGNNEAFALFVQRYDELK